MEKPIKPQDIAIRQRRWVTAAFALLALLLLAGVISLPFAVALRPDESWDAASQTGLLACASVACVLFGVPLLGLAVALFAKLPRDYLVFTDEKGLHLYSTLIPYGFIPWENIANVQYHGVYSVSQDFFSPDANHIRLTLRSTADFCKGLNFVQKAAFRLGFSRLFVPLTLCKGKGVEIGAALQGIWVYYYMYGDRTES